MIYGWVVKPYIVDKERQLDETRYLAHHDELTQLCNRRMFYDYLGHLLPGLRRQSRCGVLVYIDLDGFKPINDEYGHAMGDLVLVEVAQRLNDAVRGEDVIARLGGDEFALLVPDAGADREAAHQHAEDVARRLQQLVCQPMTFKGQRIQVGCSIGVHLLVPGDDGPEVAMKAADQAMYRAKDHHGCIVFSDAIAKGCYEIVKIGVAEIDHEHAEIDQLLAELIRGKGSCLTGLDAFTALVEMHFHNEAQISRKLGLNMTPEHLQAHHEMLTELRQMAAQRHHEDWVDQLTRIGSLLEDHVKVHDRCLRQVGEQSVLQSA
nr:diguanylate cyclase [Motiliproteus sediminis]